MRATPEPVRGLWSGLPIAIVLPATVDAVATRLALPHRPTTLALWAESLALWGAFALFGLCASWWTLWFGRRFLGAFGEGLRSRSHALLLFWTGLPVVAHTVLDRHTAIGGDFAALASFRPWLEVMAVALGLALVAWGAVAVAGSGKRRSAFLAVAVLVGVLLPWRSAGDGAGVGAGARAGAGGGGGESGGGGVGGAANVLLLVWDTARAMSLSPYGNERNVSPRLAAFAEDALLFEEARSASVFTFSSHLTMLTGAYPSQHGGRLVRMRFDTERATSVARRLREAGYRTGAFVGTSVLAAHTGVDDGFDVYDDLVDPPVCDTHAWALVHDVQSVLASLFPALRGHGRPHWFQDFQRPADDVLARAAEWIEGGDERPWFCFVNLYDVHWPYLPDHAGRENWVGPYDGPMDGFAARANHLWGTDYAPDGDDARHLTELYEAEIWELDGKVADFLDGLDPRTDAVLLTADHGEAFGEAGVWEHDDLYEPQVHVPFVVRVAGEDRPRGQVPGAVAGIDVAPTLLGLAGVAPPGGLPGLDLTQDRPEPDRAILVEDRDLLDPRASRSAVYRGGWKLEERILGGERVLRLYDLASDPVGERDLAAAHPERVEALAAQLAELRADFAASEDGGEEHSSEDALRALGYLDGS